MDGFSLLVPRLATVRVPPPTTPRTIHKLMRPNGRPVGDTMPGSFSYHYCLRSLIMHRSALSVVLLAPPTAPPARGFRSSWTPSMVGQRWYQNGFIPFVFFLFRCASLHQSLLLRALFAIDAILLLLFCCCCCCSFCIILCVFVFYVCLCLCVCECWKVDGNFACFNLFVLLILKYAINCP